MVYGELLEMEMKEMKKLHMETMSYGSDSMDEVAHQLAVAFGFSGNHGESRFHLFECIVYSMNFYPCYICRASKASLPSNGGSVGYSRS